MANYIIAFPGATRVSSTGTINGTLLVNDEGVRLDIAVSGRLPGVAIPGDINVAEIGFSRPSRV